VFCVRC